MSNASPVSASVRSAQAPIKPRKLHAVPFVELYAQRLQGVVSSGSDINRVYVAFFEAGSTSFSCSTNNNRPCGGLRGSPCKHLQELLVEAGLQFGAERVARYLQLSGDISSSTSPRELIRWIKGPQAARADAGMVFSRFLNYLRYVELQGSCQPIPEMSWFV